MKIIKPILVQIALLLTALAACALIIPKQIATLAQGIYNIFIQDYYAFKYSFTYTGLWLFLLLRAFPLLISLVLLFLFVFKWVWPLGKRSPVLMQFLFYFFCIFFIELYLRLHGDLPGSLYKGFGTVNNLITEDVVFCDTDGINKLNRLSRFEPISDYTINEQGFRSKYNFRNDAIDSLRRDGKKIVLFIGDSHVEGWSAKPISNCFTDIIDKSEKYHALNAGIVGVDPMQYHLVAEKLIPEILPDVVVVVCCSNDIMFFDREPSPGIPIWFKTNAGGESGWLASQKPLWMGYKPNELFKNAADAYNFYSQNFTIDYSGKPWVERLCGKLVLTTKLYIAAAGLRDKTPKILPEDLTKSYTKKHLTAIQTLCAQKKIPVCLFFIPEYNDFSLSAGQLAEKYKYQFDSIPINYFANYDMTLRAGKYDPHLNNEGHKIFAALIEHQLDSLYRL
jgi:hypothetical protein